MRGSSFELNRATCCGRCQARCGGMTDAAVSFGRMGYPGQHPEEQSRLFFPDHSEMTAEQVQPIGACSSPAAPSHVIFPLNWLETIESQG